MPSAADDPIDAPSGLQLYAPLFEPRLIAPDLWMIDGDVAWMAFPGMRVPFPTRMFVIRLRSGALMVISPVTPSPALFSAIDALGRVEHLISPNAIHYIHVASWKARYPTATAWASPGVEARAASQHIAVAFDAQLQAEAPPAWAGVVEQHIFEGSPALREVVFFHQPTRTLILTDLIENFEPQRVHHRGWRLLTRLAGTVDPDGKAPLDMRLTFCGGKAKAKASAQRLIAWEPERVLLAHGRCYLSDGAAELRRAFRWTGAR
jgi:hypothetical protein